MGLQNTVGGKILITSGTAGKIATSCCCETPSTCSNGWPEIRLTVLDADYAGGNITWVGQTWTPAEVQAGTTKIVCPTIYKLKQLRGTAYPAFTPTFQYSFYYGKEQWRLLSMSMKRGFCWLTSQNALAGKWTRYNGPSYRNSAYVSNGGKGLFSSIYFGGATTNPTTVPPMPPPNNTIAFSTFFIPSTILATNDNYRIKDNYFGTNVIGGVTYTWARGNGW